MLCPISPLDASIPGACEAAEEEATMHDAVLDEKIVGKDNVTLDEHGPGAIQPKALSSPRRMLPSQEALHWLTHLPYDPACEICVQCKRPNSHHRGINSDKRQIPLLVGDYGFVKDSKDGNQLTLLILKLYPYKIYFLVR